MTKPSGKGKGSGSGSRSKRAKAAVEKKFGVAARKAAQRGGRKPAVWEQPDRAAVRAADSALERSARVDAPSDDLAVSVSRSLEATVSEVFRAFNDPTRRSWSPVRDYVVRNTIAPRLLRIALADGQQLTVTIARKGNTRCMVTVEQSKVPDELSVEKSRALWRDALARLADQLAD
jgi:hypothetical protein